MSVSTGKWTEFDQRYGITSFDDKLSATMKVTNYYNSLAGKSEQSKEDKENIIRARVALMLLKDRNFGKGGSNTTFPVSSANQDGTFDAARLTRNSLYVAAISFIKNKKYAKAQSALMDLAEKGYSRANNLLGYMCEYGLLDNCDRGRAREFYQKGGTEGQYLLEGFESRQNELMRTAGAMYGSQLEDVKLAGRDIDELESLLNKMGQGEDFNFRTKAEFYRNAGDDEQYEYYLNELSNRGDNKATVALADFYIEKNTKQSLAKAEETVRVLRKRGDSYADFIQGSCYVSNQSSDHSPEKALKHFKKYLAANSDKKTSDKYLTAAHYSALIIFNDPKAGVSALTEALEIAKEVKKGNPSDGNVAGLINDINDRLIKSKSIRRKKTIKLVVILIVILGIVMFVKSLTGKKGIDAGGMLTDIKTEISTEEDVRNFTVSVDAANIRSGAGTGNGVIASGKRGETFIATGNEEKSSGGGTWYEIYLDDSKTATGWVSDKVVEG